MIHPERIRLLNDEPVRDGRYVLYWMQASQRERYNHALETAIDRAGELNLPVVVGFGVTDDYPDANARHYAFMLQGLAGVAEDLAGRGVQLVARRGTPPAVALALAEEAALVICDRGYLRHQRAWRQQVARQAGRQVVQVETDVVVPVDVASTRAEYAARTIRPKIHRHREHYLHRLRRRNVPADSLGMDLGGIDLSDPATGLARWNVDRTVAPVDSFRGGTAEALKLLRTFVDRKLRHYAERRNEPSAGIQSDMSPYLHFGQISPVDIALHVRRADAPDKAKEAYLEELIVRRELSANFVLRNDRYDSFAGLPGWARATLRDHRGDARPARYTRDQLEGAHTEDPYWNAAQREMVLSGKMHNYMRMYWGKRLLEWLAEPREAFEVALWLNNRYELDGRDMNSYAGVGWVFGLHDRPWARREIFGTVRYMSAGGLERKFDMDAYLARVQALAED